jgi:acyl-coenzyme A synthetase/AMP-(fatty) acid ligase
MDSIEKIVDGIKNRAKIPSVIYGREVINNQQFIEKIEAWESVLDKNGVGAGTVCAIVGDYTPDTCALIFALMLSKSICVPFSNKNKVEQQELYVISGIEILINFDRQGAWTIQRDFSFDTPKLIEDFRVLKKPGLIVFSSGSTGKPKGILHNCEAVANRFFPARPGWKTLLFLMIDHFGGFNTFLSCFAYGGVAICLADRSPEEVCKAIEYSQATLLPTSPTFLNFLFASGCYKKYDMSSVRMITYGTEVMSESTLKRVAEAFPEATVKQTYGLSELGVLRSKSLGNNSVWLKIGGEGFEVRIKDNLLYIKSESSMVGYLNAKNPFDEDGWFCTDDEVEIKDDYIRIIGRRSDMINVGGQKVFPMEVETVLQSAPNVLEAAVYGEKHPIMGSIVVAEVALVEYENPDLVKTRLRKYCLANLAHYKVPVRFKIAKGEDLYNDRFKKRRKPNVR